jgi:hypothetical protein
MAMVIKENLFAGFPGKEELLTYFPGHAMEVIPEVNGHIHTPYSFSAFNNMKQPFQFAQKEGIRVLGINDFYTTDGYEEFAKWALRYRIFPLFNIEFMALQKDLQEAGIRVNDPNNPGRTYFSGKGLGFPVSLSEKSRTLLKRVQRESNRQTYQMVEKLNLFLRNTGIGLCFDPGEMQRTLAKNLFRERHIAQAIRMAVFEKTDTEEGRKKLLQAMFSGKEVESSLQDVADLENEIRSRLLKAGGPAFVEEDPDAFLSLEEAMDLIKDAGGIPCYPVLLDDKKGHLTAYEENREYLYKMLTGKGVWTIEFIPGRNDARRLKEYATWFYKRGFGILMGTEHNTPKMDPLKITCRGGIPLDPVLKSIHFEGAAIVAAHQYLKAKGEEGFPVGKNLKSTQKEEFIELGKAVIIYFNGKNHETGNQRSY